MAKLKCPKCGYTWKWPYLKWLFKTTFHKLNMTALGIIRDCILTVCPNCHKKSWIYKQ